MSTSKKHILTDELILGWIEGNLSSEESERIEKLIKSSDKNFSRFSTLYAAYKEMEEVELEVTPDMLMKRLNKRFDLDQKTKPSIKLDWLDQFDKTFNAIFNSQPAVATILSVMLVVLIGVNLLNQPEKRDDEGRLRIITLLNSPEYTPAAAELTRGDSKIKEITVSVKNQELIIDQLISIERIVWVIDDQDNVLMQEKIDQRKNSLYFGSPVEKDSIRIIMESESVIVYDEWLIID